MHSDFTHKIRTGRMAALMSLKDKHERIVRATVPQLFQHLDPKEIGDLFDRTHLRFHHRVFAL